MLTAELRTRDRELLIARGELAQLRLLTETYQRQQGVIIPGGPGCLPGDPAVFHPGVSTPALPVQTVTLAAGTGGFDDDQCVGDEALQVVIVPKDVDGSPVKAPGRAAVAAYEVTPTGLKVPIGRWEVTPEELRKVWRNGLLSSGYFVLLQWDRAPTTKRIRVVVRFVTLDGREYESDRDANVTPLPGVVGVPIGPALPEGPIPPPATPLPTVPPASVPELPPPAGLGVPAVRLGKVRPLD